MTDSTYNSTGISLIRQADILANMITAAETSWDESVDTTVNTAEDAFLGHLLRNMSLVISDINEKLQDIYDSASVANATGTRLDNLLALLGIERPGDVASTATLTLTASKACTVSAGSQYKTSAGVTFATDEALVFTAAGSDDVDATCTIYGANSAAIGDIDTIVTSIDGITAVTNAAAATPGRLRATDSEQKASHTLAVATTGEGDDASIYEALSAVTGVSAVSVTSNDTASPVDSVPAYNLYCVVIGGASADIAEAIYDNKVSSVPTYGGTTVSHYDSTVKQAKDINFDTGTAVPIFIDVELTLIDGKYDDDYATQIRDNLITHFADFSIGDDVNYNALYAPLYSVDGIIVDVLEIDTTATPVNTGDEAMSATQLATFTLANAATNLRVTLT
jgi:hypothetical protein